jgi:hypothetical protein
VILHFDFVLAIDSGNTFEVSDQVGRGDNRIHADDMNKRAADLSSSQAPAQPNLVLLHSGCPNKLDSALLGMYPHAHRLDSAVIARGFQATIFDFANRAEPPASFK